MLYRILRKIRNSLYRSRLKKYLTEKGAQVDLESASIPCGTEINAESKLVIGGVL